MVNTVEMLDLGPRAEAISRFTEWLTAHGAEPTAEDQGLFEAVAPNPLYGHIIGANVQYFRATGVEPVVALGAARILCKASLTSSDMYADDHEQTRHGPLIHRDPDFHHALLETQTAMTGGAIKLLPQRYAMTPIEGRRQVTVADRLLTSASRPERRLLSDANYSLYFSASTMANGEDLLTTTINDAVENGGYEQMPHLTRTNWAIGQLLGSFARNANGHMTVIDAGPGTGATLAAGISEIHRVSDSQNINLFAVESNPDYVADLRAFAPFLMRRLLATNPAFELVTNDTSIHDAQGDRLSIIEGDITEVMDKAILPAATEKDVAVMMANYSWHRLPTVEKVRLIGQLKDQAPNSIFLIADLARNASEINRRYFNFGNNGPLNCGNVGLKGLFEFHGYRVIRFGTDAAPQSVHPRLTEAITREYDNDGQLLIAYSGEEAERLVQAA